MTMPIASIAPLIITKGGEVFTIREARRDELQAISWAAAEAFINDVMAYYLSGTTKPMTTSDKAALRSLYDFYFFLFKACMIGGGRAVIAVPVKAGSTTIAAATCWYPPRKRITALNAFRSGIVKCIRNWGLMSFWRMSHEYEPITHGVFERAFDAKAMKAPGPNPKNRLLKETDAWYVQAIFSSKQYEGRGLMASLMREGFAYSQHVTPGVPVTLDATTVRARDRYAHLGYELMEPQTIIGAGKATPLGIAPANKYEKRQRRDEFTGVPYYCMVNWDPSASLELKGEQSESP